jgi:transposase
MTDLPDAVDQLKAILLQLQQDSEATDKLLQAKQEEVAELKTQVQLLVEQLNLSKSKRFSSQSEKIAKGTFNEAEQQHGLPKPEPKHHKKGRKPLPAALERETHKHELNTPYCECCDIPLHECGT